MPGRSFPLRFSAFTLLLLAALAFAGCNSNPPSAARSAPTAPKPTPAPLVAESPPSITFPPTKPSTIAEPVLLGIDVLAAQNFAPIAGKRVGLLTHPAGVNRFGISTVEVLRRAPNVKLVALFGPEHGIYGTTPAGDTVADTIDKRTGLPAYSLYGKNNKPTPAQLKGLDAMLIDLQDIGVRSYTFNVVMRYTIETCFANNVEVIVLDRPNPLGGLKVDGPLLDVELTRENGVGAYRIPYVHGLTMGEIARMAAGTPNGLDVPEATRLKGRLSVIPMSGWKRSMRWPETGLNFVGTSPMIQNFSACVGYAMTGLGCQLGGFTHGVGKLYPFRGIDHPSRTSEQLIQDLNALQLPGLAFRKISVPKPGTHLPAQGVFVEVTDWEDFHPTEFSFHLMRLAAKYARKNPFAAATAKEAQLFNKHTGSVEWWNALRKDGARVDLEAFLVKWRRDCLAYQQGTKKFWLYN